MSPVCPFFAVENMAPAGVKTEHDDLFRTSAGLLFGQASARYITQSQSDFSPKLIGARIRQRDYAQLNKEHFQHSNGSRFWRRKFASRTWPKEGQKDNKQWSIRRGIRLRTGGSRQTGLVSADGGIPTGLWEFRRRGRRITALFGCFEEDEKRWCISKWDTGTTAARKWACGWRVGRILWEGETAAKKTTKAELSVDAMLH